MVRYINEAFVDGQWRGVESGRVDSLTNPADGQPLAEVAATPIDLVDEAVRAARRSFAEDWRDSTPRQRSEALLALAKRIEDHASEFVELESSNVGKPIGDAHDDVKLAVDNLRFFAGAARLPEGRPTTEYLAGHTSMIRREPVGVVGAIAPWNYPLLLAVWKLGPALAAGNSIILKPAEWTPLSALRLAQLSEGLLPPGVLNLVFGGEDVGAHLVEHPDVDMISLTGEVTTGRTVAAAASKTLKRVHLELGGKAPVIVFDDADIGRLVETLRVAAFANCGQDCTAATKILAADRIRDQITELLVPIIQTIGVGHPHDEATEMGPLVTNQHRERVAGFVHRAARGGARVLTGGHLIEGLGCYYEPTLLDNVSADAEISKQEVFGPVLTIQSFEDVEQALSWANSVEYGLTASLWTSSISRAFALTPKLDYGTVWINDHFSVVSEMPHGGFKQSGYGKDMSVYSLDDYSRIKHVMVRYE